MKFVTVFMIVMLMGAAGYAWEDPPAGAPRVVFPDASHVFGQALEGDEVSHDFLFRNAGQAPLSVMKVRTG